ncbi:Demethylmenaquinone methyltransferase [Cytospora mali]|uniref:Demethylmenaquinone methyltransferase n=1 Tax=Cytospora mali TaxID=578113 RepID=A0A194VJ41_CYTMA|nr:Demethylmenaquinone methyltransferase [Valsa mali]
MSTAVGSAPEGLLSLTAEQAFDSVGPAYEAAFADLPEQAQSINWLLSQLEASDIKPARFVDIGCGTGRPVCSSLADAGHDVLGIDVSSAMINAARERVPNAKFEQIDFRNFNPPQQSLDAASVYFSMIADVTQQEIKGFIADIYRALKPGGLFVFATLPLDVQGVQVKWMGRPMTVSSLAHEVAVETIRTVGFELVHDAVTKFTPRGAEAGICQKEEVWEEPHLFVYARKPTTAD